MNAFFQAVGDVVGALVSIVTDDFLHFAASVLVAVGICALIFCVIEAVRR